MRTTVELSEPVYLRLRAAALSRGVRGFSPIVEEALSEYFESEPGRRELAAAVRAADGAWSNEDVVDLERERELAWSTWRPARS
jgi:hypothetical protein